MKHHLILLSLIAVGLGAAEPAPVPLFDGTTFSGWEGDTTGVWRIEDRTLVAGRLDAKQPYNDFLCTTKEYGDFDMTVSYRSNACNGGIQFRSQRVPNDHELKGYQADFFKGHDGSLYDESRRNKMLATPDAGVTARLMLGEWNRYRIRAVGPRIQLWVNDILTVDFTEYDPTIPRRGIIGLQIHKRATEIRYRDLTIIDLDAGVGLAGEPDAVFAAQANQALGAMQVKVQELKLKGVAIVAVIPGDKTRGWTSRMQVADHFIIGGKTNVLAVAYAKMAEMADTLQRSGLKTRARYNGENGYEGGVIAPIPGGYFAAAFSGGPSDKDLQVAQAGLNVLVAGAARPAPAAPKPQ